MSIKRQQIIDAIVTRFQGIRTTATPHAYYFNLGLHVISSRPQLINSDGSIGRVPVEASECPCIMVRDPLDTTLFTDLDGNEEHRVDLEIEVRHEGGTVTDTDLRKMEQDVRYCVGVDTTWSGLARDTSIQSCEKILLQADKIIGGLLFRASITFDTAAFAET